MQRRAPREADSPHYREERRVGASEGLEYELLEARHLPPPCHLGPHRHDDLFRAHPRGTVLLARHAVKTVVEYLAHLVAREVLAAEERFRDFDLSPRPGPLLAVHREERAHRPACAATIAEEQIVGYIPLRVAGRHDVLPSPQGSMIPRGSNKRYILRAIFPASVDGEIPRSPASRAISSLLRRLR